MEPQQFIKGVLVGEVKDVMAHHAYLAFPLIGIGIEFLGRALDTDHDWDYSYPSSVVPPFDRAMTELFPKHYQDKRLRNLMRNGLLHFYRPKRGLLLSEVNDAIEGVIRHGNHPYRDKDGNVTLVVEYLYIDFVDACHQVIRKRFPAGDKMRRPFLRTDIPVSK
jgi:hypothetical protein